MGEGVAEMVAFYRAQLDKDEQVASAAISGPWVTNEGRPWSSEFCVFGQCDLLTGRLTHVASTELNGVKWRENRDQIARHDPARTLARVKAGRRLIERYERAPKLDGYAQACLDAIRDAAAAYAGESGYREEWAP